MKALAWTLAVLVLAAAGAAYVVIAEQRIGAVQAASDLAAKDAAENRSTSEARIRSLEGQLTKLQADLRSRPAVAEPIVVSRALSTTSDNLYQGCVRYRVVDTTQERCVLAPTTPTNLPGANFDDLLKCYLEAQVGSPLPKSCK